MKRLPQTTLAVSAVAAIASAAAMLGGDFGHGQAVAKPAASGVTVKTRDSQFGTVLFSRSNRAIYYFDKESGKTPKCYGACAEAWPPVLTGGSPQAAGAVRPGMLGTTQRGNGKRQVTYKGHPLYFYVDDPRGEVLCHNVDEFGGLWLAVKPNGKPVGE